MKSSLTPQETQRLEDFRQQYFKHGTCTAPADRHQAEAAFAQAYRFINRQPVPTIWTDSPMTANLLINALTLRDSLRGSLGDSLRDSLGDSQLTYYSTLWLGQQDAYWVSYYVFCETLGVRYDPTLRENLAVMDQLVQSTGWWYPFDVVVIASERPRRVQMEPWGARSPRIHSEHGPAVAFRDGWAVYALHGVRFEPHLFQRVVSRSMSAQEILALPNTDQRVQAMKFATSGYRDWWRAEGGERVAIYDKVDGERRVTHYELWHVPKGRTFTKDVRFMLYDCPSSLARGTPREYAKGVPCEVTSVPEAMAWGMSSKQVTVTPEQWELMVPLRDES